jgi:hypothetical protein
LQHQPTKAQINLGLSLWLDEKWGSRQRLNLITAAYGLVANVDAASGQFLLDNAEAELEPETEPGHLMDDTRQEDIPSHARFWAETLLALT